MGRADREPPRLAASIAPGPPPVATTWCCPSRWPSRAASAYAGWPRSTEWPPITPTSRRLRIQLAEGGVDGVVVESLGQRVVVAGRRCDQA